MNNNGSVVSFGSKFALFQRGKSIITLFLWVKMKVERVMGIEPNRVFSVRSVKTELSQYNSTKSLPVYPTYTTSRTYRTNKRSILKHSNPLALSWANR